MTVLLLAGLAILVLAVLGLIANVTGVDSRDGWTDRPDNDSAVRGSI
jgi:hypothetical protein